MSDTFLKGQIVRAQSGFFIVETIRGQVTATLRGRFLQGRQETDAVALGDRVLVEVFPDGSAVIEEIEDRTRVLSRKAPGRESEQVLVANLDQAVFMMACADPDPNFRMLDRFLVVAERENLPAVICANKLDLVVPRSAREEFGLYDNLGYRIVYTSAVSGRGVRELRRVLSNKLSVFAGPSGVGKSTLLNAVQPGLGLRTHLVREKTKKGHHTTVVPELFPLKNGGYVADTPGLKAFALWDIEPEELDAYFPEMRDLVADCDFSDCTHIHEPGCAVLEALDKGRIAPERYDSYCRIRLGEEED
ncbi:MAG: ribosome small subunit-dependent GTPase A [Anaerolineales bacterium]|nr:ribosome small subunit-dependent GTPase A [Anaerolineales bacterium]